MRPKSLLPLLIVTPMRIEARALRGTVEESAPSHATLVCLDAIGASAAAALTAALEQHRPGALLLAGYAGGLDPALAPGTLVLAGGHRHASELVASSAALLDLADRSARHRGIPHRTGAVLTVDQPLTSPDAKASASAATGAAAVDMEGFWLARTAAAAGVPFVAVRAISDGAADVIPDYVAAAANAGLAGQLRRIAPGVARRPADAVALARLAVQARAASRNLARFVAAFLDELA